MKKIEIFLTREQTEDAEAYLSSEHNMLNITIDEIIYKRNNLCKLILILNENNINDISQKLINLGICLITYKQYLKK